MFKPTDFQHNLNLSRKLFRIIKSKRSCWHIAWLQTQKLNSIVPKYVKKKKTFY